MRLADPRACLVLFWIFVVAVTMYQLWDIPQRIPVTFNTTKLSGAAVRKYSKKYFHEAGTDNPNADLELNHYDKRFFKETVNSKRRKETQQHMVRSYLDFFREKGLETWIAHGTLLGYFWNGKVAQPGPFGIEKLISAQILPWDFDIDMQVSDATLFHIGEHWNGTFHNCPANASAPSPDADRKTFFLDVNSHASERTNGDGLNVIDARWIDVETGLYIDITGLSELEPKKRPGVVSCRNFHSYKISDLYPLRQTVFEEVPVLVPNNYIDILKEEYSDKALTRTKFEG